MNQGKNFEAKALYDRKTKGMKGNKDLERIATNAVANLLLRQAFAVVKRGTSYEDWHVA